MRITYDTEVDALTLVVSREPVERTVDVREGRFIDLDADGNIVAIEILDASDGFELRDLVEKYDLRPVIEALAGQIAAVRKLWHGRLIRLGLIDSHRSCVFSDHSGEL